MYKQSLTLMLAKHEDNKKGQCCKKYCFWLTQSNTATSGYIACINIQNKIQKHILSEFSARTFNNAFGQIKVCSVKEF